MATRYVINTGMECKIDGAIPGAEQVGMWGRQLIRDEA